MSNYKVGFIGGGNMARALAGGLLSSGYRPENLMLAEPSAERRAVLSADLSGVLVSKDNSTVADRADCLVLAVKPQLMREVCLELADIVQAGRPLVISVAAGTHSRDIDAWLGNGLAVVRVMPNQPALLLKGASGLFANEVTSSRERDRATEILSAVGSVVHVADAGRPQARHGYGARFCLACGRERRIDASNDRACAFTRRHDSCGI
jgi:pyrroline-5-carboxylate reductase